MAVAVAVSEGGVVAVAMAGLTKRFLNYIQKDFLIDVWGWTQSYVLGSDWEKKVQTQRISSTVEMFNPKH